MDLAADDDEDEDGKDYWARINFTPDNFDEVREYVKTYYIEEKVDERRAFIEAASFALLAMDKPRQLLPETFYKARKGHPEEEGGLDGKTYKLRPEDPFLVHILPDKKDKKKEKRKRLTDEEILTYRKKALARRHLLEESWNGIPFDDTRVRAVLKHIEQKTKGEKVKKGVAGGRMKKYVVAAAQGYLWSLDPHSSLISQEAWEEATRDTTDGSFEGIGAILTTRGDNTIVESPLEGRPAHKAGLRAGDVILKVDDKEIVGMPLHKVVKRIRGPKGKAVALTIRREGEPEDKVVTIVRAHIDIKNVTGKLVPHHKDLGYVKLTGFVPTSMDELEKKFRELEKKAVGGKLRGLIFDLRNNSGGLLQQGVKIADFFVPSGTIVTVKNRMRRDEVYRAHRTGTELLPLIVLVNDGSASASEIVASAIQDNGRGLLVGDRTFGKASVQTLFSPILRKDYYIKLTIARYYSPSGRTIQVVGVNPDLPVPPTVGGKMPVGFREENLSHYLKPIDSSYRSPNAEVTKQVAECAKKRGIAERIHAADPNPQVKFDYQLMRAADYLECYIDLQLAQK